MPGPDMIPADERPHPAGPELRWSESWSFDFVDAVGSLGGWVRLTLLPNLGTAWYHAFLVGPGRQLVAVADTDVPLPGRSLEIRTTGLWATHICETAHDHWTIGLEAFGLGVDDPRELYGRQLGDRVPLGFDLEWEASGAVDDSTDPITTYHQPCRVSGEILVGSEQLDFDGWGRRARHWGPRRGWDQRWLRLHGRLEDGTVLAGTVVSGDLATARGSIDGDPAPVEAAGQIMTGPGMPGGATMGIGPLEVSAVPVATTPVELVDPEGRRTRAPRALCRLTTTDGRHGHGWVEWNEPQP